MTVIAMLGFACAAIRSYLTPTASARQPNRLHYAHERLASNAT